MIEAAKFIISLVLDSYESQEEHDAACKQFIYEVEIEQIENSESL
jgi:hypothetical protein